jgi:hypothetical protein
MDAPGSESLSWDGAPDLPPGLVALRLVEPALPGRKDTVRGAPAERDIGTALAEHDRFQYRDGRDPTNAENAGSLYRTGDGLTEDGLEINGSYQVKDATHAEDRLAERITALPSSLLPALQQQVDTLKLPPGNYHVPLRDRKGTALGWAAFKGVPGRKHPVLATVLAKHMTPRGENIEARLKAASEFTTDQLDPRVPEQLAVRKPDHLRVGVGMTGSDAVSKAFDDFRAFGDSQTLNTLSDQMGGDALNDVKAAADRQASSRYGVTR